MLEHKGNKSELSVYFESTNKDTFVADVAEKARAFEALFGVAPVVYVNGTSFKEAGDRGDFIFPHWPGIEVTGLGRRYFEGVVDGQRCKFRVVDHETDTYRCYLRHPAAVIR